MASSDYNALLTALGPKSASGFIEALESRGIYVIDSAEDPEDLNADNIKTLLFNGVIFWFDPADALTAHDGVTCIVTADGKRFKSDGYTGISNRWVAVIDKDLAAPPGSPALGDKYIVAAAATGLWTGHSKQFATWTARGWVFEQPIAFDYAFVIDEVQIYHYSAAGVWTSGIPATAIGDATISLKKLKYFPLGVSVINQTTDAPPGSPADGDAYIVGPTPSGAWAGHTLDVAIFETSAWIFYDGYEGAEVYDKALDSKFTHTGSVWANSSAMVKLAFQVSFPAAATVIIDSSVFNRPFKRIEFFCDNVSSTVATRVPTIELSGDNGASFGAALLFHAASVAAATGVDCHGTIDNADVTSGQRLVHTICNDNPQAFTTQQHQFQNITTGYINCIRFAWNSTGNFDSGTYTIIGWI